MLSAVGSIPVQKALSPGGLLPAGEWTPSGLANIFIFQVIINISSSLNIIPTKGMTLPFISYGGSSFISSSIIVGFILLLVKEEKNGK